MIDELIERFKGGDTKALARLITYIENYWQVEEILRRIYKDVGNAYRIGITGPPGAGKSTLVDKLAVHLLERGFRPSIIAVDPSSPFTGGAVLGDRLRMVKSMERGIFIRSMASRGSLGGLAETTGLVADLMDAFGYDVIIIETIGVGQSEVDIVKNSDTVVVVLVPEAGDAIQAMKAGLMEIADVFVVNKADREGADRFLRELAAIVSLSPNDWKPPIIKTVALRDEGIDELVEGILSHREFIKPTLHKRRVERLAYQIEDILTRRFLQRIKEKYDLEEIIERFLSEGKHPYELIETLEGEFIQP